MVYAILLWQSVSPDLCARINCCPLHFICHKFGLSNVKELVHEDGRFGWGSTLKTSTALWARGATRKERMCYRYCWICLDTLESTALVSIVFVVFYKKVKTGKECVERSYVKTEIWQGHDCCPFIGMYFRQQNQMEWETWYSLSPNQGEEEPKDTNANLRKEKK